MLDLPSFAVVIPMYNEKFGAQTCVRQVCAQLAKMPHRANLIVVNDGSQDGTSEVLATLESIEQELIVLTHPRNRGYGAALRTGLLRARDKGFDYVVFMDSDLTNDPADIPKFAAQMERGIDVIKASRFIGGGGMQGVPWQRAILSVTGNFVARALFRVGLRDCTNGFRAIRVPVLASMHLKERGFPIILEELYQAKWVARSFCEVPVVLTARRKDLRSTSFSYRPETFRKYLAFALKAFLGVKPDLKQETV
jgi:dolichol-phosphate mannosyltransferase